MQLSINPSSSLLAGFIILPIFITLWWIWVSGRAFSAAGNQYSGRASNASFDFRVASWAGGIFIVWLSCAAYISFQDWAHNFELFPPYGVRVFFIFIVVTVIIAFSKIGKTLALFTPLWLLVGFQSFRIPLELLIYQAYLENVTIIQMTYLGRNFDILTGILALLIAMYAYKNKIPNSIVLIWNVLGMFLLINVVATGVMSMPHAFQIIKSDFPNTWVTYFPFVWLPYVLVCSALFGHLLVFRYLWMQKKN